MTIICNKCGIEKNINCFFRCKRRPSGFSSICKTCEKNNRENPGESLEVYEDFEIKVIDWPVFKGSIECVEMR